MYSLVAFGLSERCGTPAPFRHTSATFALEAIAVPGNMRARAPRTALPLMKRKRVRPCEVVNGLTVIGFMVQCSKWRGEDVGAQRARARVYIGAPVSATAILQEWRSPAGRTATASRSYIYATGASPAGMPGKAPRMPPDAPLRRTGRGPSQCVRTQLGASWRVSISGAVRATRPQGLVPYRTRKWARPERMPNDARRQGPERVIRWNAADRVMRAEQDPNGSPDARRRRTREARGGGRVVLAPAPVTTRACVRSCSGPAVRPAPLQCPLPVRRAGPTAAAGRPHCAARPGGPVPMPGPAAASGGEGGGARRGVEERGRAGVRDSGAWRATGRAHMPTPAKSKPRCPARSSR